MHADRSPLVELFRTGDVDLGLRLLAAQGDLMPQAQDDIALLVTLTHDRDAQVARTAQATLTTRDRDLVAAVAGGTSLASALERAPGTAPVAAVPAGGVLPVPAVREDAVADDAAGEPRESTRARILTMGLAERVLLALRGSRAERAVLVTDPSRAVGLAVLSSPGVTESEVESITRMPQVHEDVLRAIASQRTWVRHYGVVVGLVRNPRTPAAVSLNLLSRLQDRDLRLASTDRNIPDIVRVTARRKVVGA